MKVADFPLKSTFYLFLFYFFSFLFFLQIFADIYSQQLTVEDSDDTRALRTVGGSTALTFLEGCGQLHDLIPPANILQKHKISRTPVRVYTSFS